MFYVSAWPRNMQYLLYELFNIVDAFTFQMGLKDKNFVFENSDCEQHNK